MSNTFQHGKENPDFNCSASQIECDNTPMTPCVSIGHIVMKVPVVLAELTVQVNMDATITFPEPVLEIKDIKKRVKVTQCRLLLPTKKVFIKGFVRKNIQYASPSNDISQSTACSVSSDLHSFTIDIPFQCVTEIRKFLTEPVCPEFNQRQEFDFFISSPLPQGFPEKDRLLSSDLSQFHQESSQFYNELTFCEIVSSQIVEWDEAVDRMPLPNGGPFEEGIFTTIEEKMILDLTLKILQNQQVRVKSRTHCDD